MPNVRKAKLRETELRASCGMAVLWEYSHAGESTQTTQSTRVRRDRAARPHMDRRRRSVWSGVVYRQGRRPRGRAKRRGAARAWMKTAPMVRGVSLWCAAPAGVPLSAVVSMSSRYREYPRSTCRNKHRAASSMQRATWHETCTCNCHATIATRSQAVHFRRQARHASTAPPPVCAARLCRQRQSFRNAA